MEGDLRRGKNPRKSCISIHALRVEGDSSFQSTRISRCLFLSTPSGWRATEDYAGNIGQAVISIHALRVEGDRGLRGQHWAGGDFYPRPPGGGRPAATASADQKVIFLSTPSGWRATSASSVPIAMPAAFLSTPSGWRATSYGCCCRPAPRISIHALRVEGDSKNGQSFRLFLRKREKNLPL